MPASLRGKQRGRVGGGGGWLTEKEPLSHSHWGVEELILSEEIHVQFKEDLIGTAYMGGCSALVSPQRIFDEQSYRSKSVGSLVDDRSREDGCSVFTFACSGCVGFLPSAPLSLIIFNMYAVFVVIIFHPVTLTWPQGWIWPPEAVTMAHPPQLRFQFSYTL